MPAEGLFALHAHPSGVALKGDRRRCAASSNPGLFYVGGSNRSADRYREASTFFLSLPIHR